MALTLVKGIQCPSLEQKFLFCDKIYLDAICDLFIQNKGGKKSFLKGTMYVVDVAKLVFTYLILFFCSLMQMYQV